MTEQRLRSGDKKTSNSASKDEIPTFPSTSRSNISPKQTVLKQLNTLKNLSTPTKCLLCEELWPLPEDREALLAHLLTTHHLVISDIDCIADLKGYIDYWRIRLSTVTISDICSTLYAPVKVLGAPIHVEGENQRFFLLSDILPEDRLLRDGLQKKRLEWVLQQQQFEREDSKFTRGCLFCREVITGTRAQYLNHLSHGHNLQLGHPHNLVFIDELIDLIEKYFERLQCLYCENFFKDRLVLREHMRKKMHKRINPSNHIFDQYYAVNYLEIGKNWVQVQSEREERECDGFSSGGEDCEVAEWEDWRDDNAASIACLFCHIKLSLWENMMQHLKAAHNFDFPALVSHMDFYQKVKLVNYIRHQMDRNICIVCEVPFQSAESLREHMNQNNHLALPDDNLWDRPEYYFPTHEDDGFLCQLDDIRGDAEGNPECVSGEDPNPLLCEALSEAHISEVMELKAAITGSTIPPTSVAKVEKQWPSEKHVSFQATENID